MMKSNKSKKKKLLAAAAALALIAAVSGTFAWITAQDQRINRVESAAITDGSVTVTEVWTPQPIVADTAATKEVSVTNSGNASVFVRVSYEEVLKHLTSLGNITKRTVPYVASSGDVPVEFDGAKYIAGGYIDITSQVTLSGGGTIPTGVQIWGKGAVTADPLTGTLTTSFEYAMFYEYDTGKYQAMDQTITVTGSPAAVGTLDSTWTFEAASLDYHVYAGGYSTIVKNWATSSLPDAAGVTPATGYALLGTSGSKYGVTYDYTAATLGVTLPTTTPQALVDSPQAANVTKGVLADRDASFVGTGINIKYGADIVPVSSLANDQWVYNEDDGFFYWTSPLGSGNTTADLMKQLVFDSTIDKKYTNATYDLIVKMEAIQATKAALTDSAGWKLSASAGTTTTAIMNYLDAQVL